MQSKSALVRWEAACLLLTLAVPGLAALTCKGDGCIIPLNMNLPYSSSFRSVCNKLDTCYYCGNARGVTKRDCDHQFFLDMLHSCSYFDTTCKTYAWIQYFAVVVGAQSYWVVHCPLWCHESWVSDCLPPPHTPPRLLPHHKIPGPPSRPFDWKMLKEMHDMSP